MAKETLHVVPHGDGWAVKREGNERQSSTHNTQREAIDAARNLANDGDDLVIHRPDGTIRERHSYQESDRQNNLGNGRQRNGEDGVQVRPHDVASVGTRVRWSAILAGLVVTIAVSICLGLLAFALGLTTADFVQELTFGIASAVVALVSLLIALFLGGYVASLATVREEKGESILYGVLVWGSLWVFAGLMTAAAANVGMNAGWLFAYGQGSTETAALRNPATGAVETPGQAEARNRVAQGTRWIASDVSPQAQAWLTFGAAILTLLAAIGGAIAGAGPELVLRRLRERGQRAIMQQTPNTAVQTAEPSVAR